MSLVTPGHPSPDPAPGLPSAARSAARVAVGVLAALLAAAVASRVLPVPSTEQAYRRVVDAVGDLPGWAHGAIEAASELGIVALAVGLALVGWRARGRGSEDVARVLVGGGAVVGASLLSEALKLVVAQERPCAALADVADAPARAVVRTAARVPWLGALLVSPSRPAGRRG